MINYVVLRIFVPLVISLFLLGYGPVASSQELLAQSTVVQIRQVGTIGTTSERYKFQELLIVFNVDNVEIDTLVVLQSDDHLYLPLSEIADSLGIEYDVSNIGITLSTPFGEYLAKQQDLLNYKSAWYISDKKLIDDLYYEIKFDPSKYVINAFLPWDKERKPRASLIIEPDINPASLSLKQLRADFYYDKRGDQDSTLISEYTIAGAGLGGQWGVEYVEPDKGEGWLREYGWSKTFDNQQLFVGRDTVSVDTLVPGNETTGVQWAWSNQALKSSTRRSTNISDFDNAVGASGRVIDGYSEPGSIAELRIADRVISSTRVGNDGFFEFRNVNLASGEFNQIEVVIFNRQRTQIIDRKDYSMQQSKTLLNKSTSIFYASAGLEGNAFDNRIERSGNNVYSMSWRTGLTNSLSLNTSITDDGEDSFQTVGFTSLLFNRVNTDFTVARRDDYYAYLLDTETSGDDWRFRLRARTNEENYSSENAFRVEDHRLTYEYDVASNIRLHLIGQNTSVNNVSETYAAPGISGSMGQFFASILPISESSYQLRSRWSNGSTFVRYDYQSRDHYFNVDHRLTRKFNLFSNISAVDDSPNRAEIGFNWQANDFSSSIDSTEFSASILSTKSDVGYTAFLDTGLLPGISGRFSLERDPEQLFNGNLETAVSVELTADFAYTGSRIVPAESGYSNYVGGALSAEIFADGVDLDKFGLGKAITVKVNGRRRLAALNGNFVFVDGVEPGVHSVQLDGRDLPFELTPRKQQYWIKIVPGGVTKVDFHIDVLLGFSGRIYDSQGNAFPNANVRVLSSKGIQKTEVTSNQFGLYRVDRLEPGIYQVIADTEDKKKTGGSPVVLKDAYIFGQDIILDREWEQVYSDVDNRDSSPVIDIEAAALIEKLSLKDDVVKPIKPEVTVINDKFEAADKASAVVAPAIVTPYGPEFNVSHIPVDGCASGSSASFIQLASYTDLTVVNKKLAEYSIDKSFIDFYDGKSSSAMRQYRIAVGPFTESEQDLAARAKRYEAITGAKSWTRYRACDDVRRHPPVNVNQDLDVDERAAEALVDDKIETIKIAPAAVITPVVKPDANVREVTHIALKGCPSGDSASFIQLITYSELASAQKQLAKYSIDDSFIDFYDRKVGNTVKRQYRIAVGPFTEASQNLADRAKRYENITGAKSWTRTRACDDVRRHP